MTDQQRNLVTQALGRARTMLRNGNGHPGGLHEVCATLEEALQPELPLPEPKMPREMLHRGQRLIDGYLPHYETLMCAELGCTPTKVE